MDKILNTLRNNGLVIENETEMITLIERKSYYRYLKLTNIYRKNKGGGNVSQSIINSIYKEDIKLRRSVQKITIALEVSMRAELHNSFYGLDVIKVSKESTTWENEYLVSNPSFRKPYVYAKRGFRWSKGWSELSIQNYFDGMTFGHLIATYFAISHEKLFMDFRSIEVTEDNLNKLDAIRIIRNTMAHHGFLYALPQRDLKVAIAAMFSLFEFPSLQKDKIYGSIKKMYSL